MLGWRHDVGDSVSEDYGAEHPHTAELVPGYRLPQNGLYAELISSTKAIRDECGRSRFHGGGERIFGA
jgi:hypothetical protein